MLSLTEQLVAGATVLAISLLVFFTQNDFWWKAGSGVLAFVSLVYFIL